MIETSMNEIQKYGSLSKKNPLTFGRKSRGITSYSTGNGTSRSIPKAGNAESIKDKAIQ